MGLTPIAKVAMALVVVGARAVDGVKVVMEMVMALVSTRVDKLLCVAFLVSLCVLEDL